MLSGVACACQICVGACIGIQKTVHSKGVPRRDTALLSFLIDAPLRSASWPSEVMKARGLVNPRRGLARDTRERRAGGNTYLFFEKKYIWKKPESARCLFGVHFLFAVMHFVDSEARGTPLIMG